MPGCEQATHLTRLAGLVSRELHKRVLLVVGVGGDFRPHLQDLGIFGCHQARRCYTPTAECSGQIGPCFGDRSICIRLPLNLSVLSAEISAPNPGCSVGLIGALFQPMPFSSDNHSLTSVPSEQGDTVIRIPNQILRSLVIVGEMTN